MHSRKTTCIYIYSVTLDISKYCGRMSSLTMSLYTSSQSLAQYFATIALRVCVCVCVCVCMCMCMFVWMNVCVCCICMCMYVWENVCNTFATIALRERESVCACIYVYVYVCMSECMQYFCNMYVPMFALEHS